MTRFYLVESLKGRPYGWDASRVSGFPDIWNRLMAGRGAKFGLALYEPGSWQASKTRRSCGPQRFGLYEPGSWQASKTLPSLGMRMTVLYEPGPSVLPAHEGGRRSVGMTASQHPSKTGTDAGRNDHDLKPASATTRMGRTRNLLRTLLVTRCAPAEVLRSRTS